MQDEKPYLVFRAWVCTDTLPDSIHGVIDEFLQSLPSKQVRVERVIVDYPLTQFPPESECKNQLRINIRYDRVEESADVHTLPSTLFKQIDACIRAHPRHEGSPG